MFALVTGSLGEDRDANQTHATLGEGGRAMLGDVRLAGKGGFGLE